MTVPYPPSSRIHNRYPSYVVSYLCSCLANLKLTDHIEHSPSCRDPVPVPDSPLHVSGWRSGMLGWVLLALNPDPGVDQEQEKKFPWGGRMRCAGTLA